MLAALCYHQVGCSKHSNPLEMLDAHFQYIAKRYSVVLPGEPLKKGRLSVCLTFDDASYDFYHYVYPLLKKWKLRALLAVPTAYILDQTSLDAKTRLEVPYTLAMQEGIFETKAPFCTWSELREMVESGFVKVASHSHLHCNLTFDFVDLQREVVQSKEILEEKLVQPICSFVYPFGRTNERVDRFVANHYPHSFRLGTGYNFSWNLKAKALLRICCDRLISPEAPFAFKRRALCLLKSFLH